jgi:hypothetical protein
MSALHAIVYVSSAVRLLEQPQIDHLLARARERNAQAHLTGLLLYGDGSFMQYIEGPQERLMPVYNLILADPLHRDINELLNEPVGLREFGDWSMAYQPAMLPRFLEPVAARRPRAAEPAGGIDRLGPGGELLRSVWARLHGRPR